VTISNLDEIEKVHEVCKKIKEDSDYKLSIEEGRSILATYEQSFRDLGMI